MIRRIGILFILGVCFLAPAWAQQPIAGAGVQNTSAAAWTSSTSINTAVTLISNSAAYNSAFVTLVQGTTITAGVLTFQQSIDNTNWTSVQGITVGATTIMGPTYTLVASTNISFLFPVNAPYFRVLLSTAILGTGTVTIQSAIESMPSAGLMAGTESLASSTALIGGVNPCITQTDPSNGTAGTQGVQASPNCGTDGNQWVSIQPALRPLSFTASKSFAGSSTTDNAVLPGNASNTVLVTRVLVSCTQTTTGVVTLSLIKRSAADTSGTSSSMTAVPDDSSFSSAVSAPLSYTSTGPTAGAAVGNVDTYQLGCMAASSASPNDIYILDRRLKPIVLRGTAQQLAVNFGGAITGGTLTVTFEWEEVKTITP